MDGGRSRRSFFSPSVQQAPGHPPPDDQPIKAGNFYLIRTRMERRTPTEGRTLVLNDRTGALLFDLAEYVVAARSQANDLVIITPKRLARLNSMGKAIWEVPELRASTRFDEGIMFNVSGSDLIVLTYNAIADSGVRVVRVHGADGGGVFATECDGLGVPHSKYSQHVTAEITKDRLVVLSHGSGGWFGETLDIASGKSTARSSKIEW